MCVDQVGLFFNCVFRFALSATLTTLPRFESVRTGAPRSIYDHNPTGNWTWVGVHPDISGCLLTWNIFHIFLKFPPRTNPNLWIRRRQYSHWLIRTNYRSLVQILLQPAIWQCSLLKMVAVIDRVKLTKRGGGGDGDADEHLLWVFHFAVDCDSVLTGEIQRQPPSARFQLAYAQTHEWNGPIRLLPEWFLVIQQGDQWWWLHSGLSHQCRWGNSIPVSAFEFFCVAQDWWRAGKSCVYTSFIRRVWYHLSGKALICQTVGVWRSTTRIGLPNRPGRPLSKKYSTGITKTPGTLLPARLRLSHWVLRFSISIPGCYLRTFFDEVQAVTISPGEPVPACPPLESGPIDFKLDEYGRETV